MKVEDRIVKFIDDYLPSTPGIAKHILAHKLELLVAQCMDDIAITICDECGEIGCDCG